MTTSIEPGQELPGFSHVFTRADLVRYAEASGDDNPIHLDDEKDRKSVV